VEIIVVEEEIDAFDDATPGWDGEVHDSMRQPELEGHGGQGNSFPIARLRKRIRSVRHAARRSRGPARSAVYTSDIPPYCASP
jgi:hypothetical protein